MGMDAAAPAGTDAGVVAGTGVWSWAEA